MSNNERSLKLAGIAPLGKGAAYLALASLSCLLFSAFTPPLLTPEAASRLPLIGGLPGDLPGYWARFSLSFLLLGAAPALMALAFREKPADLGLNFRTPILRKAWYWLLLPLCVAIGAIGGMDSGGMGSFYPYSRDLVGRVREAGLGPFFGHYAAYFFLYYAPWEFFFRGFLLFPFLVAAERVFSLGAGAGDGSPDDAAADAARGMVLAAVVLFQTIPSTMLHFGHPLSELTSAVAAGIIFGVLAWKTRSIIPGLLVHAAMGFGTDLFIVCKGAGYI
jgi:membrane protease YdiL (CAAX protease family)